jgi:hypothetical protein
MLLRAEVILPTKQGMVQRKQGETMSSVLEKFIVDRESSLATSVLYIWAFSMQFWERVCGM